MSLFGEVIECLRAGSIPHAVIGATALAVHGVARSTADLDVLATHAACFDASTWKSLAAAGARVDIRPGDGDDPLAGVVRFERGREAPVDLVVGRHAWQADSLRRARLHQVMGVDVPVVSAADLVRLKLYAGGPQDRWDIVQLLTATDRDALVAEITAALDDLPHECRALWEQLLADR